MAGKWFPGKKDAKYWRERRELEYRHKEKKARLKRIENRPEPTVFYTATTTDGVKLKIGRADSSSPWYLETTRDGSVSVNEMYKMSKKSALEYITYVAKMISEEEAEINNCELTITKNDVDTLQREILAKKIEAFL